MAKTYVHPVAQLRTIALSRIVVPDGFNPRGEVADDAELDSLAQTMRRHGCLQPIRVREDSHGDYVLIAGERRYRAAVKAALTELPAIVRPAGADNEAEAADLLVEAVIENEQRSNLDPISRARAYDRLRQGGLTVKGIAEHLGVPQARVRERLAVLELPEDLHPRVAAGEIPQHAVKALVALAKIHPGLPTTAVGQVLDVDEERCEPSTWAEVNENALRVALYSDDELPAGVYRANGTFSVDTFELGEKAVKDLAAHEKLTGRSISAVRFTHELHEQARALGAVHGESWEQIVVGEDVACQLAGDYIAMVLKAERAQQRRERESDRQSQDNDEGGSPRDTAETLAETAAERERRAKDQASLEREAQRQAREDAIRFNADLGIAVFKHLSKIKVDERVLKVLTAIDLCGELPVTAMRGARYGFPDWLNTEQTKGGKTKTVYLDRSQAEAKAGKYLAGATTAAEVAGRCLALIVMAVFADENAVAQSSRSFHTVRVQGVPWKHEVPGLIDELVSEKLPEPALAPLREVLSQRQAKREQDAGEHAERHEARERLEAFAARDDHPTLEEIAQADQDLELAYTWDYSGRAREIRDAVERARQHLTEPEQPEQVNGEN